MKDGGFVWHELMTGDAAAAAAFYGKVVGWTMADSGMPGVRYTLAKVGERPMAGLMEIPPEMPGLVPCWRGYVLSLDVDAKAAEVAANGGTVHRPPADIPGVGRLAVVADPQGAVFMLFRGDGTAPPDPPPMTPGTIGWNELKTTDWAAAFAFYEKLFGWEKAQAVDMGPMGTYQTFMAGGAWAGGMMGGGETPSWLYYFTVDDIEKAAKRVGDAGGTVGAGPHEVPGGSCRVDGDVAAPIPHRPGRAGFPHPVPHERDLLAAA